jgi:hypothetical protein
MDETLPSAAAQVLDLLRRAYVDRLSGELRLDRGDERRGLAMREGHVVYGVSDAPGERLGDVLVRHGDVSREVLERADAVARSEGRRLGVVLVETGILATEQLEDAVATHVRVILYSALEEPPGTPFFEPLADPREDAAGWVPVSRLSTGQLLLDAARTLSDPSAVREAFGNLDRTLVLGTDPRLGTHPLALTPADGFVLSRVDGTLSARELVGLIPLPPEDTEKSLLGLLCSGAIAFGAERSVAPHPPPQRPSGAAPASPAASSPTTPSAATPSAATQPPAGAQPPLVPAWTPEDVRRLIVEAFSGLKDRDHFEVLGVTIAAGDKEIRAAYARLAKALHPDACRDPALADIDEQRAALFVAVREAYEVLRDPKKRAAHEVEARRRRPRPATAAPPASAPPAPPATLTPEQLEEIVATGEELVQEAQYGEAMQAIEPVLPRTAGPLRVRALMTLARASRRYPERLRQAEACLQEVLREDEPLLEGAIQLEALLLLGEIYKASALPVRAAATYRKVLTIHPGNRRASRELAALQSPTSPPSGGGSLLGFLKKR